MHDHDSRPPLLIAREMNDIRARENEKALLMNDETIIGPDL